MQSTNTTTVLEQFHNQKLKGSAKMFSNIKSQFLIRIQMFFTMFTSKKNIIKFVSVLSLVLAITFFINPNVASADNFSDTCEDITLNDLVWAELTARCRDTNNNLVQSTLQLDNGIENVNGNLEWSNGIGDGDALSLTCSNCSIFDDESLSKIFLQCGTCRREDGSLNKPGLLDLDERISNINGVLTFDP